MKRFALRCCLLSVLVLSTLPTRVLMAGDLPKLGEKLTDEQVVAFSRLALKGLDQEYPNKPSNVVVDKASVRTPREMHPAFFGCFDWHSALHGHWMLIRILKQYPDISNAAEVRAKLATHLTLENMKAETDYFNEKANKSFERMYGWAWTFRLAAELHTWDDEQGKQWRENIRPLENKIVALTEAYLPRLSHPIRTGVHPDSGWALGQTLDYARTVGNKSLEKLVVQRCRDFYHADRDYPAAYEPSGEDFFSAGLNEADTMRRVLDQEEFSAWLDQFFPGLRERKLGTLLTPVEVTDVTDGKLVHLAGLDLSRGWTLQGIASALPKNDPRANILQKAAVAHAAMGYKYVFSGHYEGEHWLATFAIYLHTNVGISEMP